MKAIILAAGVGSRLRPITEAKPKTLVEVNGKPMLGYLIDNLIDNNISEIVICIGYKGEKIRDFCGQQYPHVKFSFVENVDFEITNNMYSLYLARKYLQGDIILMNADLVYEETVISGLLKTQWTCVAVDKGTYDEESMKVIVTENGNICDIAKTISQKQAFGRSIDVYKIAESDLVILKSHLLEIVEWQKERNQWTEVLLQQLFQTQKIQAKPYLIGDAKWVEIDNYEDLHRGEMLFNKKLWDLKKKKLFLLDKDGTLTLGKSLIPWADTFINFLQEKNLKYVLLSNNSSKIKEDNLKIFSKIGLHGFDAENFITSLDVSIHFFRKNNIKKLYICGNEKIVKFFLNEGFIFDDQNPEAILLTYDTTIDYEKMCTLHTLIKKEIPYYATHIDVVCPIESGTIPDIGAFIALLQASTDKQPLKTFGKPSNAMIEFICEKYNVQKEDIVLIGDRLYTDVAQKNITDMMVVLTLTGESKRGDVEFFPIKPDIIIDDLIELAEIIKR